MIKTSLCFRAGCFLAAFSILAACNKNTEISVVKEDGSLPAQGGVGSSQNSILIEGTVSDSMCGADHSGMLRTGSMGANDRTCVLECVKAGSKFVLVESKSKKVWRLSNQELPAQFAGEKVLVQGRINNKTVNEIVVFGIKRSEP